MARPPPPVVGPSGANSPRPRRGFCRSAASWPRCRAPTISKMLATPSPTLRQPLPAPPPMPLRRVVCVRRLRLLSQPKQPLKCRRGFKSSSEAGVDWLDSLVGLWGPDAALRFALARGRINLAGAARRRSSRGQIQTPLRRCRQFLVRFQAL